MFLPQLRDLGLPRQYLQAKAQHYIAGNGTYPGGRWLVSIAFAFRGIMLQGAIERIEETSDEVCSSISAQGSPFYVE